ncbi:MAG: VWD domain-containing protein [Bacteroidota bacterium]
MVSNLTKTSTRALSVYVSDLEIELKNEDGLPGAFVDGQALNLPASMSGVLIQRVADFVVVRDPESDFYVKWDGVESVFVRVGEENIGNTEGLCGVYDRQAENDFTTNSNKITKNVDEFARSWAQGGQNIHILDRISALLAS